MLPGSRPPWSKPCARQHLGEQVGIMSFGAIIRRRQVGHLRQAALGYAAKGWRVVPGAIAAIGRCSCDRMGCRTQGLHPTLTGWEHAATSNEHQVAQWWAANANPQPVLLSTGVAFEAIEVPGHLGPEVYHLLNSQTQGRTGPVAILETPTTSRWLFFVRPDGALRPELERRSDIVLHTYGSWIAAPPTKLPDGGTVRWHSAPSSTQWLLPNSYVVQAQVYAAIDHPVPVGASGGIW